MAINYASFADVVKCLNTSHVNYLVLRNYYNLLTPNIFQNGHEDIDLLCENYESVVDVLQAMPFHNKATVYGDGVHFYIIIGGQKVSLDIRSVGDGYYCDQWERDMLKSKVLYNGFYVMNEQHHFHSLIYHAILQKRSFSQEYADRLSSMARDIGISINGYEAKDYMKLLNAYMRQHNYHYCYCTDIYVPLRKGFIDGSLFKANTALAIRHKIFDTKVRTIEILVKVKHFIKERK